MTIFPLKVDYLVNVNDVLNAAVALGVPPSLTNMIDSLAASNQVVVDSEMFRNIDKIDIHPLFIKR
jgi:hypothetical protein